MILQGDGTAGSDYINANRINPEVFIYLDHKDDPGQGVPIVRQSRYQGGPWDWVLWGYRERHSRAQLVSQNFGSATLLQLQAPLLDSRSR